MLTACCVCAGAGSGLLGTLTLHQTNVDAIMQQALCRAQQGQQLSAQLRQRQPLRTRTVVFAEGREGKPIREFREDTGEVSVPGQQQQQQNGAIYADQVAMVSLGLWFRVV